MKYIPDSEGMIGKSVESALPSVTVTPVSALRLCPRRGFAAIALVARGSLAMGFVSLLCSSCLDAPPEFDAATRTAPVIAESLVFPALTGMTTMRSSDLRFDTVEFNVPFQSEDLGAGLNAFFVRNHTGEGEEVVGFVPVAANSVPFEEQEARGLSLSWQPAASLRGCTTVTLFLSHQDNFENLTKFIDPRRGAMITWWFNFTDGEGDNLVADCPSTQLMRQQ